MLLRNLLVRSVAHPEIPENHVQALIWAILARPKPAEMPPGMQDDAAKLLTTREITDLGGGALGALPDDIKGKLFDQATGPLRPILQAEDSLRSLLSSKVDVPYTQLERVAVLSGDPPDAGKGPQIPRGRWSYQPGGWFIRYFPDGYSHTHLELSLPGSHTVERDSQGRLARITDGAGNQIILTYTGDAGVPVGNARAYAFKSVQFEQDGVGPHAKSPDPIENVWNGVGWTLVGPMPESPKAITAPAGSPIVNAAERVGGERAVWDNTLSVLNRLGTKADGPDGQMLVDLSHLQAALSAIDAEALHTRPWLAQQANLVDEAWQETFARIARRSAKSDVADMAESSPLRPAENTFLMRRSPFLPLIAYRLDGCAGGTAFNPAGSAAMPADRSRQRLAQSPRANHPFQPAADTPFGPAIQQALSDHGIPPEDVAAYKDSSGNDHYVVRLGHGDNHPLPTQDTAANSGRNDNEGAQQLLLVSVQQSGDQTRVNVRTDDVETGVVTAAGKGTSDGTDGSAVTQAANQALDSMGFHSAARAASEGKRPSRFRRQPHRIPHKT